MRTCNPVAINRRDYAKPNFAVPHTRLHVSLAPDATEVSCTLTLERRGEGALRLDGADASGKPLHLVELMLDGRALDPHEYQQGVDHLAIHELPARCELVVVTRIDPASNTALEGLYLSGGNYCTQCEAEGFRKITYYLDRPDVLSVFDVTIEAPRESCPVLLSNGNLIGEEDLGNGRHLSRWHDPHPKPCYLFALVAGDLDSIEDSFVTHSGREVALYVFTESHNIRKCDFAMASLKAAMSWDEDVYGFEHDLERFTIVAVDDFNMGAMENKGLNIFNSRYVLADAESATDTDFLGIEAVVAHEYFHNWTGNRITCRDWFQLSLKEGLTVFRDQCFTSDRHSATVKRIEDVRLLRARQFPEDASPMAHPIRPDSYIEINNFYTLTVYEKGAEVIRMMHTLLGADGWQRGMALYVERHDGTAATCDDFVAAMEAGSGVDLSVFRRWYSTAGTPELRVDQQHDAVSRQLTLTVQQYLPDVAGQHDMAPLHFPLHVGLLSKAGEELPLGIGRQTSGGGAVLDVTKRRQSFLIDGVDEEPVLSLLRGFSAPVRLRQELDDDTLAFLMAHDTDAFNRWEAGQRLATRVIERVQAGEAAGTSLPDAVAACLDDRSLEPAFQAEVLALPSLDTLSESQPLVDIHALADAREEVRRGVADRCCARLIQLATAPSIAMNPSRPIEIGRRRLENAALELLGALPVDVHGPCAESRYESAANMTDRMAALQLLCHDAGETCTQALQDFHERWRGNRLVIDKWFAVQALSTHSSTVSNVERLCAHADFDLANPDRVRSLIGSFAMSNPVAFHAADGRGHRLLADHVISLDALNPQIAARLVVPLGRWARFSQPQSSSMRTQLERIRDCGELSPDVFELVTRSLAECR